MVDRKIIVKGGPKQYKSGPRLKGSARLYQRFVRLMLDVEKAMRKPGPDQMTRVLASELHRATIALGSVKRDA